MLDIREGDFLVVGSVSYRIVSVGEWLGFGNSASFTARAVIDCSTKRSPAVSGGKVGAPVTNLSGLKCTPLDPINAELTPQGIPNPIERKQAFLADSADYVELVIEQIKNG